MISERGVQNVVHMSTAALIRGYCDVVVSITTTAHLRTASTYTYTDIRLNLYQQNNKQVI